MVQTNLKIDSAYNNSVFMYNIRTYDNSVFIIIISAVIIIFQNWKLKTVRQLWIGMSFCTIVYTVSTVINSRFPENVFPKNYTSEKITSNHYTHTQLRTIHFTESTNKFDT